MSNKKSITMSDIDEFILGNRKDVINIESETISRLIDYRRRFLNMQCNTGVAAPQIRRRDLIYATAITVIVPVHNTSDYLEKCIDSILAQTFKDFELICVDDASSDDSWTKLKAYQARDPRIRIVQHEHNLGLGGARNTALKLARGEYVASVDSDDYIDPNMLKLLYDAARKEDACIVVCGFQRVRSDGTNLKAQRFQPRNLINEDKSLDIFSTCNPAFWNKLWRTELFTANEIFFPEYVFYQDLATTPRILTRSKKITFIADCPYFYLIREGSATYSHTSKHVIDYFTVFGILRRFLYENGLYARYEMEFNTALVRACKFRAENILQSSVTEQEKRQQMAHVLAIYHYFLSVAPVTDKYDLAKCLTSIDGRPISVTASVLPMSIMVKTICRPNLLERFLNSVGEYQRDRQQIFSEILVGDDSPEGDQTLNAEVIARVSKRFPDLHIKHLVFEYDIGCSSGRNRIVQAASADNILQCDDDFILDATCDIASALTLFEAKNVDIMGGWLKNKYDLATGEFEFRVALGFFRRENDVLTLSVNEDKYDFPDFAECQFIMNFFIAKRRVLMQNPWDWELKTEEHHEFFYRAAQNGVRTSFSKLLYAKHTHEKPNNSTAYNTHRFDKERWRRYLFLSLEKCNANVRIIETKKHDRMVIWKVDRRKKTSKEEVSPLSETPRKSA